MYADHSGEGWTTCYAKVSVPVFFICINGIATCFCLFVIFCLAPHFKDCLQAVRSISNLLLLTLCHVPWCVFTVLTQSPSDRLLDALQLPNRSTLSPVKKPRFRFTASSKITCCKFFFCLVSPSVTVVPRNCWNGSQPHRHVQGSLYPLPLPTLGITRFLECLPEQPGFCCQCCHWNNILLLVSRGSCFPDLPNSKHQPILEVLPGSFSTQRPIPFGFHCLGSEFSYLGCLDCTLKSLPLWCHSLASVLSSCLWS